MNLTEDKIIDPQSLQAFSEIKQKAAKVAIKERVVSEENPVVLFYNLTLFKNGMKRMKETFPSNWLHTIAVKANAVSSLMKISQEEGLGFETASWGELNAALSTGISPQKIVFDSPAKSKKEITLALEKGIFLNVDNFQELHRIAEILQSQTFPSPLNIGIRINPQIGLGTIKEMSTSGKYTKFGIGSVDYKDQILEVYSKYSWLNGIHVHVGSQGCSSELMLKGIRTIVNLVLEINKHCGFQQIKFIDIGGGLPVNFDDERESTDVTPSIENYANMLKSQVPELFSGEYIVITEYGRRYLAKPGFILNYVEYTKRSGGRNIATIQAGADLYVRTVYMAKSWPIRVSVLNKEGEVKRENYEKQDIAGPCCFSGDIIAHERNLPLIEQGDFIVAHDTGAYYYSSYSMYNLHQAPPIYGFEDEETIRFHLLKKGQTLEETLKWFS